MDDNEITLVPAGYGSMTVSEALAGVCAGRDTLPGLAPDAAVARMLSETLGEDPVYRL